MTESERQALSDLCLLNKPGSHHLDYPDLLLSATTKLLEEICQSQQEQKRQEDARRYRHNV